MNLTISRKVDAPPDRVFKLVSNIPEMSKAFPDKEVKIEVLTENVTGLGARFREFRRLGKKEDVIELEITEYVPSEHVVSETLAGGSIWQTGFAVVPEGEGTLLTLTMAARPQTIFARIMNLLIKSSLKKGAAEEIDSLKTFCERAEFAG